MERVSSSGGVARWTGLSFVRLATGGGESATFRGRLLVGGGGGEAVGEGVAKLCTMGEPLQRAAGLCDRPKVESEDDGGEAGGTSRRTWSVSVWGDKGGRE